MKIFWYFYNSSSLSSCSSFIHLSIIRRLILKKGCFCKLAIFTRRTIFKKILFFSEPCIHFELIVCFSFLEKLTRQFVLFQFSTQLSSVLIVYFFKLKIKEFWYFPFPVFPNISRYHLLLNRREYLYLYCRTLWDFYLQ